jgi:Uma2 family endonuclease
MTTIFYEGERVTVPSWVVDLDSFRRWMDSDDFPDEYRVWFLKGEVWIDMSKEQVFTHVLLKNEFAFTLTGLAKAGRLGLYFPDGLLLSNDDADISGNPDGTFISYATLDSDQVRLLEGKEGGCVEVVGTPDMVLEVVSDSSVEKDTEVLRAAYWEAGIREYWLVDGRQETLSFDILRHTARGYVAARKQKGWVKSAVFGKEFRLTQRTNKLGHPEYTLEVR